MRAIVQTRYGSTDVLRIGDRDRPVAGAGEVLIRVRATSLHPDVWHLMTGLPRVLRLMGAGLRRPACPVPGTDMAGVVEQVGSGVTRFQPGDEVFGETMLALAWRNGGAFAEYVAVPADCLAHKPTTVTFEQAAAVPSIGYITLLNVPADRLRPATRVLVNGAGGGVGGMVVELAKASGAHVTGVDHTRKLDRIRSLGADEVIDYTVRDFTQRRGGSEPYDLIVDIPGNHSTAAVRRVLAPTGRYVLIGHDGFGRHGRRWLGSLPRFGGLMLRSIVVAQLRGAGVRLTKADAMATLAQHLAAGRLIPVIDRTFPLEQAAEAMRYLIDGDPIGRVVLTV